MQMQETNQMQMPIICIKCKCVAAESNAIESNANAFRSKLQMWFYNCFLRSASDILPTYLVTTINKKT